jgi:hypothetical protein
LYSSDPSYTINDAAAGTNTLDIIVDNWGRNNFGQPGDFDQKKGLQGPVYIDNQELTNITAIPLEFKSQWVQRFNLNFITKYNQK